VRRQGASFSGVLCDRETPHLRADTESRTDLRIPLAFDVKVPLVSVTGANAPERKREELIPMMTHIYNPAFTAARTAILLPAPAC